MLCCISVFMSSSLISHLVERRNQQSPPFGCVLLTEEIVLELGRLHDFGGALGPRYVLLKPCVTPERQERGHTQALGLEGAWASGPRGESSHLMMRPSHRWRRAGGHV